MVQPDHNSLCRIARPKRFATRRHRPSPMAVDAPLLESRMDVENPPLWASMVYDQWWLNRAATSSEEVFVPLPAISSKVSRPLVCRGWRAFRVSPPRSPNSMMDIELMTKLPSHQQAASAKSNMENARNRGPSSLVSPCLVLPSALASALYSMSTAKEAAVVSEEQVHPSEPAPEPKSPALISMECPAFIGEEQLVLLSEKP
ncbi:unnamed protein product [Umbelopsis vinacea]